VYVCVVAALPSDAMADGRTAVCMCVVVVPPSDAMADGRTAVCMCVLWPLCQVMQWLMAGQQCVCMWWPQVSDAYFVCPSHACRPAVLVLAFCALCRRWCLPAAAAAAGRRSSPPALCCMASRGQSVSMVGSAAQRTKHEGALQQGCLPCFSTQPCQEGSAYSCTSAPPQSCPSAAVCQPRLGTCVFQAGAAAARVSRASRCVGWVRSAW
jgi:hypothetical protein